MAPAAVSVQRGVSRLTFAGEITCSAAWKCVSLMFCPANGHCPDPDPDDGTAAALPGWAMRAVIATAAVTVAAPMSAARVLVGLWTIRFMLFSLVGNAPGMSTALRCEAHGRCSMKGLSART